MGYTERLDKVKQLLALHEASGFLITHLPDIRWLVGFSGSSALLLVKRESVYFITDGRYTEQAHQEVRGAEVHIADRSSFEYLAAQPWIQAKEHILFQGEHLVYQVYKQLLTRFPEVAFEAVNSVIAKCRATKDSTEIRSIQGAQQITDEVFSILCERIRPGITEKELAAEIVYEHLRRGAERMSFDPIVAFGPHSALPHAQPSDQTLRKGDVVLLDFGCFYEGYASDMTRTLVVGHASETFREVYQIVLCAQEKALKILRANQLACAVDAAARRVIEEAGYGEFFTHSLGHGVGLEIHEWPRLSQFSEEPVPLHAVVTVEPGVYIPGQFGVRIEDLVVVEEQGVQNLTRTSKDLLEL